MRRGVIALDRTVGVVVALALIAAGVLAVVWWHSGTPHQLTLHTPPDRTQATWWPWATGAAGVVVALLGLWWLAAHLPRRVNGRFHLTSRVGAGRLFADAHAAVAAAAADLSAHPEIRDASGRVVADRGELVADLQCTIEPSADLEKVRVAVTQAAADLHAVLGLPRLRHRVRLRVARNDRTTAPPRVV
ncbi:hypothetical protein JOF29_004205 [Kribbella aluminosa]|uniref:Alkaline shock response membrane anchor protein AmaP n=1 Tax=Kribbella aluminosa TaxID=416017 RepID=A0ABS4UNA0_9ACTN|nr:hypothetical protein [Kribbella aluminosa]MBP2353122.1 hypothetical protein [Kribbella aluminosa]